MKRRAVQRVERRRPLADLNLIAETKPRLGMPRRGCLSFLTPVLLGLAALAVLQPGLR
ncbi:MAG TPA: hypothetical protein VGG90_11285 [Candidatus Dormibacteraeota bacterium]